MRFKKKHKYGAKKTVVDGITFDSKFEASYYTELKILENIGSLKIIDLQPKIYLTKAKILYKPDFLILEGNKRVWIDVKGMPTPVFNLKKRLWKHYGPGELRLVYRDKVESIFSERGGNEYNESE